MFQAQIGKRLSPRYSQPLLRVVPLNACGLFCRLTQVVSLSLSRATITKTLGSTDCGKFDYSILSLCLRNFSAHFTTGFMYQLYNSLQEKFKVTNGFLSNQNRYALIYGWSLQPLNQQSKYARLF